jgi:hypothetical protein
MTNKVTIGQNGYFECSCGHTMLYIHSEPGTQRTMKCVNRACQHFDIPYKAPTFEVEQA